MWMVEAKRGEAGKARFKGNESGKRRSKGTREGANTDSNDGREWDALPRGRRRSRAEAILAQEISFVMSDSFRTADLNKIRTEVVQLLLELSESERHEEKRSVGGWTTGPLLHPEAEKRYFWLFNFLKFRANSVRTTINPRRPSDSACDLFEELIQLSQAIRERIICGNLRLVISIAKNCKTAELSFDELCSEGVLALLRAVDCFNIERGFRFSTYAYTAIARAVHREAGEARTRGQRQINGVPLASLERVEENDPEAALNEDAITRSSSALRKLLGQLNPREQLVINSRYGLDRDQAPMTFQRLGEILGVSKERVRQIEARALRELKRMAEKISLHQVTDNFFAGASLVAGTTNRP